MRVVVTTDIGAFAGEASDFLTSDVTRNVLATTAEAALAGDHEEVICALGYATASGRGRGESLIAAAIRTPPRHMLAWGFDDDTAAERLVAKWRDADPELTGVSAPTRCAQAISRAWAAQTADAVSIEYAEALHVLTELIPPNPTAPGNLRRAGTDDIPLLVEWGAAFVRETGFGNEAGMGEMMARRVRAGSAYVWEHDGPQTLAAHSLIAGGTARVGPIYTPPERRGTGYATAATAALSAYLLAHGAERCMLYTDLANPISNHVYAKIGYERICDWEERGFVSLRSAGLRH